MDLYENIETIRMTLGFCDQKDVLFDYFTVEEQLKFAFDIKGLNNQNTQIEIENIIHKVIEYYIYNISL